MPDRNTKETADRSSDKRPRKRERPPTGTKGEELSSQGQVDEATRRRTGKAV
jgi:hypothetical protein